MSELLDTVTLSTSPRQYSSNRKYHSEKQQVSSHNPTTCILLMNLNFPMPYVII